MNKPNEYINEIIPPKYESNDIIPAKYKLEALIRSKFNIKKIAAAVLLLCENAYTISTYEDDRVLFQHIYVRVVGLKYHDSPPSTRRGRSSHGSDDSARCSIALKDYLRYTSSVVAIRTTSSRWNFKNIYSYNTLTSLFSILISLIKVWFDRYMALFWCIRRFSMLLQITCEWPLL